MRQSPFALPAPARPDYKTVTISDPDHEGVAFTLRLRPLTPAEHYLAAERGAARWAEIEDDPTCLPPLADGTRITVSRTACLEAAGIEAMQPVDADRYVLDELLALMTAAPQVWDAICAARARLWQDPTPAGVNDAPA